MTSDSPINQQLHMCLCLFQVYIVLLYMLYLIGAVQQPLSFIIILLVRKLCQRGIKRSPTEHMESDYNPSALASRSTG